MLFTLIAIDVELASGSTPISVGVATLNERAEYTSRLFSLPGIRLPTDESGEPVLQRSGQVRNCRVASHGDFSEHKWTKFWRHNGRMLALQLDWDDAGGKDPDAVWIAIREHIDYHAARAAERRATVRVVADNAGIDIGVINENLKRIRPDDDTITLDHMVQNDGNRRHSFVVDARSPRWQRQLGILRYQPWRLDGIKLAKHFAPHDALLSLCEYAGYIQAYPMVEWPKK